MHTSDQAHILSQILFKNNKNEEEEEDEEFLRSDYYKDYMKQKKRQEEKKLGKTEDGSAAQKHPENEEKISEENLQTETVSPDSKETESKCAQSQSEVKEVKKVVSFDILEKVENKERIAEDCSPKTDAIGGGDSHAKEDIDPRNILKL